MNKTMRTITNTYYQIINEQAIDNQRMVCSCFGVCESDEIDF